MTIKDWLEAAAAALVILSALGSVRVSMVLRSRDRQDFERLRESYDETVKELVKLREKVAGLSGRQGWFNEDSTE